MMTPNDKMQKQVTELAVIVPQIKEKVDGLWNMWFVGDGNGGYVERIRQNEKYIKEQIAGKKSTRELFREKIAYVIAGVVLSGVISVGTIIMVNVWR